MRSLPLSGGIQESSLLATQESVGIRRNPQESAKTLKVPFSGIRQESAGIRENTESSGFRNPHRNPRRNPRRNPNRAIHLFLAHTCALHTMTPVGAGNCRECVRRVRKLSIVELRRQQGTQARNPQSRNPCSEIRSAKIRKMKNPEICGFLSGF